MPKYQMYLISQCDSNGNSIDEYRLHFVHSVTSLSQIAEDANIWTKHGHAVMVMTEPDPADAWKSEEDLLQDFIERQGLY